MVDQHLAQLVLTLPVQGKFGNGEKEHGSFGQPVEPADAAQELRKKHSWLWKKKTNSQLLTCFKNL